MGSGEKAMYHETNFGTTTASLDARSDPQKKTINMGYHRNIDIMEGLLKHVWNLWRIIYIYIYKYWGPGRICLRASKAYE